MADAEIARVDVSADDTHLVHVLDSVEDLNSEHQDSRQRESVTAHSVQVVQIWPEQVHDCVALIRTVGKSSVLVQASKAN